MPHKVPDITATVLDRQNVSLLEVASDIHCRSFQASGHKGWTAKDLATLLSGPAIKGYIFQHGEVPIGMLLLSAVGNEAELITLAVVPDQQRKGYGALILQQAIQILKALNIEKFMLEVRKSNENAVFLYKKTWLSTNSHQKRLL